MRLSFQEEKKMRISARELHAKGFVVRKIRDDGKDDFVIEIYPEHPKEPQALIDLLVEEYGLKQHFAYMLAEDLHQYQVVSALIG